MECAAPGKLPVIFRSQEWERTRKRGVHWCGELVALLLSN